MSLPQSCMVCYMFHDGRYNGTSAILEPRAVVSSRGKNKQKMPKSPRTSTPGEQKALRSKAWSEETELYIGGGHWWVLTMDFDIVMLDTKFFRFVKRSVEQL